MRIILALFTLCLWIPTGYGQESPHRIYRQFRTVEAMHLLQKQYPETFNNQSSVERFNFKKGKRIKPQKSTLPLVFHIVYSNPEEKISLEQIQSQIDALNRDFGFDEEGKVSETDQKENFSRKATDTELQFCLAEIKGNGGKETSAINYIETTLTDWTYDNKIKAKASGGTDPLDPQNYINIWVSHLADTVSGYAQMPGGPEAIDGIVIDYRFFGTTGTAIAPYNEGKSLTHLMGNYLNLYPLWGQYNCTDDYVFDTPIHNHPNFGCPEYKHISMCDGYPAEMQTNFMDNTDDACMFMFTYGQKSRMHAVLTSGGAREGLLKSKVKCEKEFPFQEEIPIQDPLYQSRQFTTIQLFPNPSGQATTFLEINAAEDGAGQIQVFDLMGKLQYSRAIDVEFGQQQIPIITRDWVAGIYVFRLTINQQQWTDRLVISR